MATEESRMVEVWFAVIILFFILLATLSFNAGESLGAGILILLAIVFFISYVRYY